MTNSELIRVYNIKRSLKALLPDAGEVRIEEGTDPLFKFGLVIVKPCFWLYIDNPQTSISFWDLDELEDYVIRKIHALSLLQISTPTPEQRRRKIALKRMYGNFEDAERN